MTASEVVSIGMLIDSGSALNLVSGTMARKLQKKGCIVKTAAKQVGSKVANGKRSTLNTVINLQLQLDSETSESTELLILNDLPFDLILGDEALLRWDGKLGWRKATFTVQQAQVQRKSTFPVLLVAHEDAVLRTRRTDHTLSFPFRA